MSKELSPPGAGGVVDAGSAMTATCVRSLSGAAKAVPPSSHGAMAPARQAARLIFAAKSSVRRDDAGLAARPESDVPLARPGFKPMLKLLSNAVVFAGSQGITPVVYLLTSVTVVTDLIVTKPIQLSICRTFCLNVSCRQIPLWPDCDDSVHSTGCLLSRHGPR